MNYRHAFHAGNFADLMKHITLVRVIEHLKQKQKPFRFIDTHAGTGLYDLSGDAAQRSGEWRHGIGAVLSEADGTLGPAAVAADSELGALLAPYFGVLNQINGLPREGGGAPLLRHYPGAGEFARRLLRPDDRLVLNELHDDDARALRQVMRRDERVRTLQLDGWMAAKSVLPPKERRGVMLVDPPFELAGEFKRLQDVLDDAVSRFATGVTLLWYPIKAGGAAQAFVNAMAKSGHTRLLAVELLVRHRDTLQGLNGSGLIIHNPPYGLDGQLRSILPWLEAHCSQQAGSDWNVDWLAKE